MRVETGQTALVADIGVALNAEDDLPAILHACAGAVVRHLDAAFARIWTLNQATNILELQASVGLYTHLDGPHSRVPVGALKIGLIAEERRPHLTNDVSHDPRVSDKQWAAREGMIAFAGYPLIVGDRLVGVLALFARRPLGEETLAMLSSVVQMIATGIARKEAEARYRTLFARVPDAIFVTDADGRHLDVNPAATALLGYTRAELLGLTAAEIADEPGAETAARYADLALTGVWRGERELRRKDGERVPVEIQATVVEWPTATVYLSVIRDISARRALERMQQDFIAMVAHDLKNPLTTLKGNAQLMQRRGAFSERSVATIVAQADRLERLIDDLRDVARIDVGQIPLEREAVDLAALARERANAAQTLTGAHTIRIDAPPAPVIGAWDADRLAQVLDNLLTNAVKYSPDGGAIVVRIEAGGGEARVAISDEGIGIPPEALGRLFERFYRAKGGIAANKKGLGLGLHISKALVEAHGGHIAAASPGDRGSTFSFTLPLRTPDSPSPVVVAQASAQYGSVRDISRW